MLNIGLGASEWWGSNANADLFPENGLVHVPKGWSGDPREDRGLAKDWPYGYPTFYNAHVYQHHRNKNPAISFGDIELVTWNPLMKRVEQVIRVDHARCQKFNAMWVWDRLRAGDFIDLSMGCKVPFDTCQVCLDKSKYEKALQTYDPKKHKHPGEAALAFHRKDPIRGLAITRKDYCSHMLQMPNRILSSGVRVAVNNDFPRFFDQSFVIVGADRTSKVLIHLARSKKIFFLGYSAQKEEDPEKKAELPIAQPMPEEKTASTLTDFLLDKSAKLKRSSLGKRGEITKDVLPREMAEKVIKALPDTESDLPEEGIRSLSLDGDLPSAFGTLSRMGIIAKPREFQRIILIRIGRPGLAQDLDDRDVLFPHTHEHTPFHIGSSIVPSILRALMPSMPSRSFFGPFIEPRSSLVLTPGGQVNKVSKGFTKKSASQASDLLHKIGSAYNGYRMAIPSFLKESTALLENNEPGSLRTKVAFCASSSLLTPLSEEYIKKAFLIEVPGSGR